MSAFMVGEPLMNRVVNGLIDMADGLSWGSPRLAKMTADPDALGAALFAMNESALDARYPQGRGGDNTSPSYGFKMEKLDRVAVFKAMQCLLYQCSEGQVPESDLYKELDAAHRELATMIVTGLPQYKAAPALGD